MKKLLALLMACATMTCAFASCGDEKEESSSGSTSVSESSETETTTEEVTEEETTEEETTEAETESDTAETETEAETTAVEKVTYEYIEDADKTPFVGKWECSKLVANGEEIPELNGIPAYAVFQYDIIEDGTIALPESLMEVSDPEDPVTYTWGIISDSEIEIVGSNGSSIVYALENGQLTNIDDTEEIYLDKVDEFQEFDFKSYYEEIMSKQNDPGYVLTPVETDADGNIIEDTETITAE